MQNSKVKKATAIALSAVTLMSVAAPVAVVASAASTDSSIEAVKNATVVSLVVNGTTVTDSNTSAMKDIVANASYSLKVQTPKNGQYWYKFAITGATTGNQAMSDNDTYNGVVNATGETTATITVYSKASGVSFTKTVKFKGVASTKLTENSIVYDANGNQYKILSNKKLAITGIANRGKTTAANDLKGEVELTDTTVAGTVAKIQGYTVTQFGDGTHAVKSIKNDASHSVGSPFAQISIPETVVTVAANSINSALVKSDDPKNKGIIILGSTDRNNLYCSKLESFASTAVNNSIVPNVIFRTYQANIAGSSYNTNSANATYGWAAMLPTGANVQAPFGSWAFLALCWKSGEKHYNVEGTPGYDFRNGIVDNVTGKKMFYVVKLTSNTQMSDSYVPGYSIMVENGGTNGMTGGSNAVTIPYDVAKKYIKRTVDFEAGDDFNGKTITLTPRTSSGMSKTMWFDLARQYNLSNPGVGVENVDFDEQTLRRYDPDLCEVNTDGSLKADFTYSGKQTILPVVNITSGGDGYLTTVNVTRNNNSCAKNTLKDTKKSAECTVKLTPNAPSDAATQAIFTGERTFNVFVRKTGYTNTTNSNKAKLTRVTWNSNTKTAVDDAAGKKLAVDIDGTVDANAYYVISVKDIDTSVSTVLWNGRTAGQKGYNSRNDAQRLLNYNKNNRYAITIKKYYTLSGDHSKPDCLLDSTFSTPAIDGNIFLKVDTLGVHKFKAEVPFNSSVTSRIKLYSNVQNATDYKVDIYTKTNANGAKATRIATNQKLTVVADTNGYVYGFDLTGVKHTTFDTTLSYYIVLKKGSNVVNNVDFFDSKIGAAEEIPYGDGTVTATKFMELDSRGPELLANKTSVAKGDSVRLTVKTHDYSNNQYVAKKESFTLQYTSDGANWNDITTVDGKPMAKYFVNNSYIDIPVSNYGKLAYRIAYNIEGYGSGTVFYSNPVSIYTGVVSKISNASLLMVPTTSNTTSKVTLKPSSAADDAAFINELKAPTDGLQIGSYVPKDSRGIATITVGNAAATAAGKNKFNAVQKTSANDVLPTGNNVTVPVITYEYKIYKVDVADSTKSGYKKITGISASQPDFGSRVVNNVIYDTEGNKFDYANKAVKLDLRTDGFYVLAERATVTNPSGTPDNTLIKPSYTQVGYKFIQVSKGSYVPTYKITNSKLNATDNFKITINGFNDLAKSDYVNKGFVARGTKQTMKLVVKNLADATAKKAAVKGMNDVMKAEITVKVPSGVDEKNKVTYTNLDVVTVPANYTTTFGSAVTAGTASGSRYVETNGIVTGVEYSIGASQIQNILRNNAKIKSGDYANVQVEIKSKRSGGIDNKSTVSFKIKKA